MGQHKGQMPIWSNTSYLALCDKQNMHSSCCEKQNMHSSCDNKIFIHLVMINETCANENLNMHSSCDKQNIQMEN